MQPLPSLVDFQKEITDKKLMERLGYLISESIISHFKKRFAIEEKKISNLWTNLFDISGFGKVEVVDITKEKTILKLGKNNFAKLYVEKYGIQKEPVCHIIVGIFKNFIEKTSGNKVEAKETSCIAMGNKVCTFEIKISQ
jgi:predicted hydrocarbon binding protein